MGLVCNWIGLETIPQLFFGKDNIEVHKLMNSTTKNVEKWVNGMNWYMLKMMWERFHHEHNKPVMRYSEPCDENQIGNKKKRSSD